MNAVNVIVTPNIYVYYLLLIFIGVVFVSVITVIRVIYYATWYQLNLAK